MFPRASRHRTVYQLGGNFDAPYGDWKTELDADRRQGSRPKIAAIFSIVESCRKLGMPIRHYLAEVLPCLADRSIQSLAELTPAVYAANSAK